MDKSVASRKSGLKGKVAGIKAVSDVEMSDSRTTERTILLKQTLAGSSTPKRPKLRRYAHDVEINRLVDMIYSGRDHNNLSEYRIAIDSSSSLTMSLKFAAKVDAALGKLGAACSFSFNSEVQSETRRKLLFEVGF